MVARLDGRSFTRLTKEVHQFEAPFDVRFRDMMLDTVEHLMNCGFKVIYGYTESDEISLLFSHDENRFQPQAAEVELDPGRRSQCQVLAALGRRWPASTAAFRNLPTADLVVDYFRWRNEDAHRNALNAHCYWCLRKDGQGVDEGNDGTGRPVRGREERTALPARHQLQRSVRHGRKRGSGLYWEEYDKEAVNPVTGQAVIRPAAERIVRNLELPMKEPMASSSRQYRHRQ